MSFKRDEADPGPLAALQKRRVSDLLANCIPEDEALLLRSGRVACSLCPHRPVCDTLEALAVHRAGRTHLHNLQRSYTRNRRPQPAAPSTSSQYPQYPQYSQDPQDSQYSQCSQYPQAPLLARTRRIARSALLKSAPYSSCCRRSQGSGSRGVPEALRDGSQNGGKSQNLGKSWNGKSRNVEGSQNGERSQNWGKPWNVEGSQNVERSQNLGKSWNGKSRNVEGSQNLGKFQNVGVSSAERSRSAGIPGGAGNSSRSGSGAGLSPERRRRLQHHLKLRSSGWVPDGRGNWVKDENVEFDSDDDEPPELSPTGIPENPWE